MQLDAIKKMCRRDYESAIGIMHKQTTPEASAIPLAKLMVEKIKKLCSLKDKIRDTDQCIWDFDWEHLWNELASTAPTLLQFYKQLFSGASKTFNLFCHFYGHQMEI